MSVGDLRHALDAVGEVERQQTLSCTRTCPGCGHVAEALVHGTGLASVRVGVLDDADDIDTEALSTEALEGARSAAALHLAVARCPSCGVRDARQLVLRGLLSSPMASWNRMGVFVGVLAVGVMAATGEVFGAIVAAALTVVGVGCGTLIGAWWLARSSDANIHWVTNPG